MYLVCKNRLLGDILLADIEAFECECGEVIFSSSQAKFIEQQYNYVKAKKNQYMNE